MAFTPLVFAAVVDKSDLPFFVEDLFPLVGAGRAFVGLAFDCAFLAAVFGFWVFTFFTFAFLSLAQRAFAAALIFALASAESLRRFCGAAVSTARPADRRSLSAASRARVSCRCAICASRPMRARRSNSAGSSLLVVGIDQSSDKMLVAAPGVIPPHMTGESDIIGERRDDVAQSVTRGIVRGEVPKSQLQTGSRAAIWPTLCPITSKGAVRS